ncbi:MAG: phosphotransferase [Oligoflexia bacterium]|nr:phosphotransferase [Oligoflexia bacterium]
MSAQRSSVGVDLAELAKDLGLEKSIEKITKLAGDASLRKYFRIEAGANSYICMSTEPFDEKKYDFLIVRDFLEKSGIRVPRVIAKSAIDGVIFLEDLGDTTMLHALGSARSREEEETLFETSIDLISNFHNKTLEATKTNAVPGFSLAFDLEKLMWEVNFTIEHLFKSYLKREIPSVEIQLIRDSFTDICKRIAEDERVFTHRDYHSRNLMIKNNEFICIDFQDARMGSRTYDLASILRDSYFQLKEESVYKYVDQYIDNTQRDGFKINKKHFIETFDLMSVQRNFKAIGSFTSFYGTRGEVGYLRFIGNTFENIRRNLRKFSEYEDLRKVLYKYYYF